MPNQPKTHARTIRIDDDRWTLVKSEAARRKSTASDVIRTAIDDHLGTSPEQPTHSQPPAE